MIRSLQIILANEPRLLRSMFGRALGKMPGLEVAGEIGDLDKLPSMVDEKKPQWIIVSLSPEGSIPDRVKSLLSGHPSVAVAGIAEDGSLVKFQGAGYVETAASSLSLDQLVAAMCQQQPAISAGGM